MGAQKAMRLSTSIKSSEDWQIIKVILTAPSSVFASGRAQLTRTVTECASNKNENEKVTPVDYGLEHFVILTCDSSIVVPNWD